MNITQTFYDNLASEYDKLFNNWQETTEEQAKLLEKLFIEKGFGKNAEILDCACGIGTQAIGLASIGYKVSASDISDGELIEAKKRAEQNKVNLRFEHADFCALEKVFDEQFDIVIAMDNALPHMLTKDDLAAAIKSITNRIKDGGIFVASIRDYDELLKTKPPYSPPYIHKTESGQRVSFQTWHWQEDLYTLVQYIIDDGKTLSTSKFSCTYRATRREEFTELLIKNGCKKVSWLFPDETLFYQPIVIAEK